MFGKVGPRKLRKVSRAEEHIQEETKAGTNTKPQEWQQGNNGHSSPTLHQPYETAVSFVCDIKSDCHWCDNAKHRCLQL